MDLLKVHQVVVVVAVLSCLLLANSSTAQVDYETQWRICEANLTSRNNFLMTPNKPGGWAFDTNETLFRHAVGMPNLNTRNCQEEQDAFLYPNPSGWVNYCAINQIFSQVHTWMQTGGQGQTLTEDQLKMTQRVVAFVKGPTNRDQLEQMDFNAFMKRVPVCYGAIPSIEQNMYFTTETCQGGSGFRFGVSNRALNLMYLVEAMSRLSTLQQILDETLEHYRSICRDNKVRVVRPYNMETTHGISSRLVSNAFDTQPKLASMLVFSKGKAFTAIASGFPTFNAGTVVQLCLIDHSNVSMPNTGIQGIQYTKYVQSYMGDYDASVAPGERYRRNRLSWYFGTDGDLSINHNSVWEQQRNASLGAYLWDSPDGSPTYLKSRIAPARLMRQDLRYADGTDIFSEDVMFGIPGIQPYLHYSPFNTDLIVGRYSYRNLNWTSIGFSNMPAHVEGFSICGCSNNDYSQVDIVNGEIVCVDSRNECEDLTHRCPKNTICEKTTKIGYICKAAPGYSFDWGTNKNTQQVIDVYGSGGNDFIPIPSATSAQTVFQVVSSKNKAKILFKDPTIQVPAPVTLYRLPYIKFLYCSQWVFTFYCVAPFETRAPVITSQFGGVQDPFNYMPNPYQGMQTLDAVSFAQYMGVFADVMVFTEWLSFLPAERDESSRGAKFYRVTFFALQKKSGTTDEKIQVARPLLIRMQGETTLEAISDAFTDIEQFGTGANMEARIEQIVMPSMVIPRICWYFLHLKEQPGFQSTPLQAWDHFSFFMPSMFASGRLEEDSRFGLMSNAISRCTQMKAAHDLKWFGPKVRSLSDSEAANLRSANVIMTASVPFNLPCGCAENIFDLNINDGAPLNLTATMDEAKIRIKWSDSSTCKNRYAFSRVDADTFFLNPAVRRPPEQNLTFFTRDYYVDKGECGTVYDPQDQLFDDASKFKVGQNLWYCARAKAPETKNRAAYTSRFGCNAKPLTVRYLSNVNVRVVLQPREIGSAGVTVYYEVIVPVPDQNNVSIIIDDGSVITDAKGYALIPLDLDPNLRPMLIGRDTVSVLLYFSKISGQGVLSVPIVHKFRCGFGSRPCTDEEPERVDTKHLSFDQSVTIVDETEVPIRGKVLIRGTDCPVAGAQLCLYYNGSTTPVGNCTNSADDGSYLLTGPIGVILLPVGTLGSRSLKTPNTTVFMNTNALIDGVNFYYEDVEDVFVELTGTECGFELVQNASVTLERSACSLPRKLERLPNSGGTLFRVVGGAPALAFEVKVTGPIVFVNSTTQLSGDDEAFFVTRTNDNAAPHGVDLLSAASFNSSNGTATAFVAGYSLDYLLPRMVSLVFDPDPSVDVKFLRFPDSYLQVANWTQYVFDPTATPVGCGKPNTCFSLGVVDTTDRLAVRVATQTFIPHINKTCNKASEDWRAMITNQLGVRGGANFTGACFDQCPLPFKPETGEMFFAFTAIPSYFAVEGVPHMKTIEIGFALNLASPITDLHRYCFIVAGAIPNDDVGNSVPITNFKPLAVLRDPPGSLSYSYVKYQKTNVLFRTDSIATKTESEDWLHHEVGLYLKVGICFGVNFFFVEQDTCLDVLETKATWNSDQLPATVAQNSEMSKTKTKTGISLTWTYSMETDSSNDNRPGPDSDMFLVPSLTMQFVKVDVVSLTPTNCTGLHTEFRYDINPAASQSGLTWISRRDVNMRVIPNLELMLSLETNATARKVLANALYTWKNATAMLPTEFRQRRFMRESDFERMPSMLDEYPVVSQDVPEEDSSESEATRAILNSARSGILPSNNDDGLYTVTFGGGGALLSYDLEQTQKLTDIQGMRSSKTSVNEDRINVDLGIAVIGYDFLSESSDSFESDIEIRFTTETQQTSAAGFVLGDSTLGDEFTVDIYDDLRYGGFFFDLTGGRSACPYEPGTIKREDPKVTILERPSALLHPEEDAQFKVEVSNLGDAAWGIELTADLKSLQGDDLDVELDGVSLISRPFLIEQMNPGASANYLVTLKRGSKYDYKDVTIGVRSLCESRTFLATGLYQASEMVHQSADLEATFLQFCPRVELAGPLLAALVDGQTVYLNSLNSTVFLQVKNTEGLPTNTSWIEFATSRGLENVRFERRLNVPNAAWAPVTSTVAPFNAIDFIALEQYPSRIGAYQWNLTNMMDAEFQIRAVAECHSDAILAQLDPRLSSSITPSVTVRVDRIPPRMFNFFPSLNANYFPEKPITATFTEPIRCTRLRPTDASIEVELFATGQTSMNLSSTTKELLLRCDADTLEIEIDRTVVPIRLLLGSDVRIVIKNVLDLAGNPLMITPPTGSNDYVSTFTYSKVDFDASAFKVAGLILPSSVVTSPSAPQSEIEFNITTYVATSLGSININRIRVTNFNFMPNVGLVVDLIVLPVDATFAPASAPTVGSGRRRLSPAPDVPSLFQQAVEDSSLLGFVTGGNLDVMLSSQDSSSTSGGSSSVISMAVNADAQIVLSALDTFESNFSSVSGDSSSQIVQKLNAIRARMEVALDNVSTSVNTSFAAISTGAAATGSGGGGSASVGAVVGAAFGGMIFAALLVGGVAYYVHKRKVAEMVRNSMRVHARTGELAYNAYNPDYTPHPVFSQEDGPVRTVSLGRASDARTLMPTALQEAENPVYTKERSSRLDSARSIPGANIDV